METDKKCTLHPNADVQLTLTPTLKHYGRWDCIECGKFVVWAKSPKTCAEMLNRQGEIMWIIRNCASMEGDPDEHITFPPNVGPGGAEYLMTNKDLETLLNLYSAIHLTLVQDQKWRYLRCKYFKE
jgi:hypothetical protein